MLIEYRKVKPIIGERVFVANSADIIGEVSVGEDSSVWFGCVIRGDVNYIKIGKRVNIQDLTMIHVTHADENNIHGNPTIIEDDVTIGHKAMLHGCTIKKASLIGMSATILDDAVIGEESIVGANSLVTKGKKFPPRSLIVGSPAKVVRSLTQKEVDELYESASRYVEYKNSYI
ncbi:MAG: gamma carbonic anhydrase family protein [Epsilonproteobacteria bacterium]|nr:gamma carbonic anhydrase family protein [Campylobacterota bacterium]